MNWSPVAAVFFVPRILKYLKNKFPAKGKPEDYPDLDILAERYSKWRTVINFGVIVMMVIMTGVISYLLEAIASVWVPTIHGARFILTSDVLVMLLPGLFLGIFASVGVMMIVVRILFGDRYGEFMYYNDYRDGSDGMKILGRMGMVVIPLALLLSFLMIGTYAAVLEDRIIVNPLLGFSESDYKHVDVKKIEHATWIDSDNVRQHRYTVIYKDGYEWQPEGSVYGGDEERRKEILSLISRKSGILITERKQS